jgi:hypothetical protein
VNEISSENKRRLECAYQKIVGAQRAAEERMHSLDALSTVLSGVFQGVYTADEIGFLRGALAPAAGVVPKLAEEPLS